MALLQGIALGLRLVVALIAILLLAACVLLLRGSARRHVFAIVAFAIVGLLSLAWLIAVPAVDNMLMGQVIEATGAFVALLVPDIICATPWPYFTLGIAIIGVILAVRQLPKKQEEEAGEE